MFTVSPVSAASCRQIGRASWTRSSRAVVAPASRSSRRRGGTTPVAGLLDEAVHLQGGHQPERRRLVDAELGGDLGDTCLTLAASISRIVRARSTDCTEAVATCDSSTAVMRAPYTPTGESQSGSAQEHPLCDAVRDPLGRQRLGLRFGHDGRLPRRLRQRLRSGSTTGIRRARRARTVTRIDWRATPDQTRFDATLGQAPYAVLPAAPRRPPSRSGRRSGPTSCAHIRGSASRRHSSCPASRSTPWLPRS